MSAGPYCPVGREVGSIPRLRPPLVLTGLHDRTARLVKCSNVGYPTAQVSITSLPSTASLPRQSPWNEGRKTADHGTDWGSPSLDSRGSRWPYATPLLSSSFWGRVCFPTLAMDIQEVDLTGRLGPGVKRREAQEEEATGTEKGAFRLSRGDCVCGLRGGPGHFSLHRVASVLYNMTLPEKRNGSVSRAATAEAHAIAIMANV